MLGRVIQRMHRYRVPMLMSALNFRVRAILAKGGVLRLVGEGNIVHGVHIGVQRVLTNKARLPKGPLEAMTGVPNCRALWKSCLGRKYHDVETSDSAAVAEARARTGSLSAGSKLARARSTSEEKV